MKYQLIIIGGGASGLAAAATAAAGGLKRIAILERLPRTGKKLLATGNGRCNLGHTPVTGRDYVGSYCPDRILEQFGDVSDFFAALGLQCYTDGQGRMYPYTMTASSVLDALRIACRQGGVEELCDRNVTQLLPDGGEWLIRTETETYMAENVIFSAGGYAAPQFGTDGTAWKLLQDMQLPFVPPRPILCPLLSDTGKLRTLKGVRVKANVSLYDRDRSLKTESGEVQFTEKTISGICLFNMSALLCSARISDYSVALDLMPDCTENDVLALLYACQAVRYSASCEEMLTGIVQKPIARLILKECGIRALTPCTSLSGRQMSQLAAFLKNLRFPVMGTGDYRQAQATAGGLHGDALDEHLQVKQYPHLYVVGEAVDIHSICGGYHLHWAWSSGWCAARHIAERSIHI